MVRVLMMLVAVVLFAAAVASRPARAATVTPSQDAVSQATRPATAQENHDTKSTTADHWRFRRHHGLWWYWLPSNQWVYWVEDRWVPYDTESYAQFSASRQPRASGYAGGQQNQWGPWGPIRYDRYGNPQYPYSQRTRGIRQLGPVPAMGGIRSLPGWGGER